MMYGHTVIMSNHSLLSTVEWVARSHDNHARTICKSSLLGPSLHYCSENYLVK